MSISKKVSLLVFALTLSALALGQPTRAAECSDGATRTVWRGECCTSTIAKRYGQSCIFGTWTDNGAVVCADPCGV